MNRFSALLVLALLLCPALYSQSTDARISGIIFDTSGKVIPEASVLILNEATNIEYSSRTNDTGIYTISILPPGQYRIQVSKSGFKTIIKPGITLNVQAALTLNFTLPIGASLETVNVQGGTSLINTTDGSVSTVIDSKFVENIPLNGRSFQDLISMTPGITTASPQASSGTGAVGASAGFSVNGQRTESNNYIVDSVSANIGAGNGYGVPGPGAGGALAAGSALGTTQSLVPVDDLQEFRVLSSSYSAEYGRSPGGQFSFQTRSGTDHFHGSAFEYFRNDFFDANDWFNDHFQQAQPALRQNDFGGTMGGPVLPGRKARTFFFASYEGLRLAQPQAASAQLVPDLYLRDQAPPAIQTILTAFPLPTPGGIDYGTADQPSLAQFLEPYSVPSEVNSASGRIDHTIGSKLALFIRASWTPSSSQTRNLSSVSHVTVDTQTYTPGVTSQISQRFENQLRAGWARSDAEVIQRLDNFGGANPIDLITAVGAGPSKSANPFLYLDLPDAGHQVQTRSIDEHSLLK